MFSLRGKRSKEMRSSRGIQKGDRVTTRIDEALCGEHMGEKRGVL